MRTEHLLVCLPLWLACSGTAASPVVAPDPGDAPDEGEGLLDFDPEDLVHFALVSDVTTLPIGGEAQLGALFHIQEDWHIYWINPGESGLPTRFTVSEAPGLTIEAARFPGPVRFDSDGEIVNYGYHHSLLVPMRVSSIAAGEAVELRADATWLACRDDACVPGKGSATLRLERAPGPGLASDHLAAFQQATQALPRPLAELGPLGVDMQADPEGHIALHAPAGTRLEIFPIVDQALADLQSTDSDMRFTLQPVADTRELAVLAVSTDAETHYFSLTNELLATPPLPQGTP